MGRRKKGEKPLVRVTNHGGRLYARIRSGGRVHYLGRVYGDLTDEQLKIADALQSGNAGWFVYVLSDCNGNFKVGVAQDVDNRIAQLQTGNACRLVCVYRKSFSCQQDASCHEVACHELLAIYRVQGEWFRCQKWEVVDAVRGGKARHLIS
jgi:predicted GIY-YIG superfamily endonuclease